MLEIIRSSNSGDPFAPGLYIENSSKSIAFFKVVARLVPSVEELNARMTATNSDFCLLSYHEESKTGLLAVVDLDPPEVGQRISLLPAPIPKKVTIVWERGSL